MNSFVCQGFALFKAKRANDAVAALTAGLALWERDAAVTVCAPDEVEVYCKLLNVQGSVYLSQNRNAEAEAVLDQTIAIAQRTQSNPLGRAIALGMSGRAILKRAATMSAADARPLVLEAQSRFRLNDSLSQTTGSVTGLLINPSSLGECARLLTDWHDLRLCGELLTRRGELYGDIAARLMGLCLQAEAMQQLGGDDVDGARALIATVRQALDTLSLEKRRPIQAALARCSRE